MPYVTRERTNTDCLTNPLVTLTNSRNIFKTTHPPIAPLCRLHVTLLC